MPYAELHCHSNFSFLDGASGARPAGRGGGAAGAARPGAHRPRRLRGAPLFAEVAQKYAATGVCAETIFGAELSLGLSAPQNGVPDPEGSHLLVLADGVEGYHRLAAAMTDAQLRGDEKGRPVYDLEELAARGRGHWLVLTGCRKGLVRAALAARRRRGGGRRARPADRAVRPRPGRRRAGRPRAPARPTRSTTRSPAWPAVHGLPVVATNNVHYATPADAPPGRGDGRRARAAEPGRDGRLAADLSGAACLRSGAEMAAALRRPPRRGRAQRRARRPARLRPAQGLAAAAQARHPRGPHRR